MGTSLLVMVTGLAKSKNNTDDEKAALAAARAALEPMTATADRSSPTPIREAFNAVMAAYRLPKATDEEKAARTRAIQAALRGATDGAARDAARLRGRARARRARSPTTAIASAASDVGVAIGLLRGGRGRRRRQRAHQSRRD